MVFLFAARVLQRVHIQQENVLFFDNSRTINLPIEYRMRSEFYRDKRGFAIFLPWIVHMTFKI